MSRIARIAAAVAARGRARAQGRRRGVHIGQGARFGRQAQCVAAAGATIEVGQDVEIGAGSSLVALPGASLIIEDGVFISGGCTIAAIERLRIGEESMIAEMVSIRDHDHDPAFPPKSGHRLQGDVEIGARVWVGAKATVVRGVTIGDDAVVGAHALVNTSVPANSLAVGVPAKVVRGNLKRSRSTNAPS